MFPETNMIKMAALRQDTYISMDQYDLGQNLSTIL